MDGKREGKGGGGRRDNTTSDAMYTDLPPEMLITLSVTNIILGTFCVLFNFSIIPFYSKKSSKLVPMIYTILAFMDFLVGLSAIYQTLPLLSLLSDTTKNVQLKSALYMIAFILNNIAAKSSVFMNVLLVITRTVVILSPFSQLSRKSIKISIVVFVGILIPLITNDIWRHYQTAEGGDYSVNDVEYYSRYFIVIPYLGSKLSDKLFEKTQLFMRNYVLNGYYHAASLVCLVCMIIQIIAIFRPRPGSRDSAQEQRITGTIMLLTGVFLVCNTTYTIFLISRGSKIGRTIDPQEFIGLYVTGTQLQFLNSLLSPCIMICRGGESLKKFTKHFMMCPSADNLSRSKSGTSGITDQGTETQTSA